MCNEKTSKNNSCKIAIADELKKYDSLLKKIETMLDKEQIIFAIDGGCGSGKTTLANMLRDIYDCNVFRMDDFFLQPHQRTKERYEEVGGNVDRERFLEEVLLPLKKGETISYKRFDCKTFTILPEVMIEPKKINIVEGSYSMHPTLAEYYDFGVFLEIDSNLQRERIINRNTPELANRFFETWIPMEEMYHQKMKVKERCSLQYKI